MLHHCSWAYEKCSNYVGCEDIVQRAMDIIFSETTANDSLLKHHHPPMTSCLSNNNSDESGGNSDEGSEENSELPADDDSQKALPFNAIKLCVVGKSGTISQ